CLACGRERSISPAVERVLHRQHTPLRLRSGGSFLLSVRASDLERTLPRLGAAVREEYPIEPRNSCQPFRKRRCELVVEEVRRDDQKRGLLGDRLQLRAIAVSQGIHA